MDSIELSIFASRMQAICDEMGAVLRRAAFSPNIRDRLDYSCAVFDRQGALCAQAAHIPVHLGSMAYAMADIVGQIDWQAGDMVMLNDPYLGGTHLPDVTVIAPLFVQQTLYGFIANRAHHADIGAESPGSMPLSRTLAEEGRVIEPVHLLRVGVLDQSVMDELLACLRNPEQSQGDFSAQISANRTGLARLLELIEATGCTEYSSALHELNNYAEKLARSELNKIPDGCYSYEDVMDDDGMGNRDIVIRASITVKGHHIEVDFSGTAAQVEGNINCPLSVTAAAVYYVFRCLMPDNTPACAGSFRSINLHAPLASMVNAVRPAAVAAGNVETSTRMVDVICGALAQAIPQRIPAASHGSMNNLAMGSTGGNTTTGQAWDYYETIGGGMGAGQHGGGLSAVQTHMTNTLNTPVEVLEMQFPIRLHRYAIRRGSGGKGQRRGGDGLVREYEFLAPTSVTLLTERRRNAPWGLQGGESGQKGVNLLNNQPLPGKVSLQLEVGDRLEIQTPGGGGWGSSTMHRSGVKRVSMTPDMKCV